MNTNEIVILRLISKALGLIEGARIMAEYDNYQLLDAIAKLEIATKQVVDDCITTEEIKAS